MKRRPPFFMCLFVLIDHPSIAHQRVCRSIITLSQLVYQAEVVWPPLFTILKFLLSNLIRWAYCFLLSYFTYPLSLWNQIDWVLYPTRFLLKDFWLHPPWLRSCFRLQSVHYFFGILRTSSLLIPSLRTFYPLNYHVERPLLMRPRWPGKMTRVRPKYSKLSRQVAKTQDGS